jgi:hypothetical protein
MSTTDGARRRPSITTWTAALPLVLTAAFAVVVGTAAGGKHVAQFVDDVGSMVAAGWAGWRCLKAARRAGRDRFAWAMLGAAALAWAAGEAVWCWLELVDHHNNPFPSVADIGFLLFVPFAIVAIAGFVRTPVPMLSKVRGVLEGALVGAALLYTSWVLVVDHIVHDNTLSIFARAISLAYPVGDVMVVVVAVLLITRSRLPGRPALALVAV